MNRRKMKREKEVGGGGGGKEGQFSLWRVQMCSTCQPAMSRACPDTEDSRHSEACAHMAGCRLCPAAGGGQPAVGSRQSAPGRSTWSGSRPRSETSLIEDSHFRETPVLHQLRGGRTASREGIRTRISYSLEWKTRLWRAQPTAHSSGCTYWHTAPTDFLSHCRSCVLRAHFTHPVPTGRVIGTTHKPGFQG